MGFWENETQSLVRTHIPPRPAPDLKRTKVKAHLKKYWWIHLIVFLFLNFIGIIIAVYAAYPAIAQHGVSSSTLTIVRQDISSPTPDTLTADIDTTFLSKSSFHPKLSSFDASIYIPGSETPCFNITVPKIAKAKNSTTVSIQQQLAISNQDEFAKYAQYQLLSNNFTVRLVGKGKLKEGGLPTIDVDYNQTLFVPGLKNFAGLTITNLTLTGLNAAVGEVMIPNPTNGTFTFGDTLVDQYIDSVFIANSTIPNLTLRPGNNTYTLRSSTNATAIAQALLKPKFRSGILPVDVVGVRSSVNGQEIPYFTAALQSSTIRTELDVWDVVGDTGKSIVGQLLEGAPDLLDRLNEVAGRVRRIEKI